MSYMPQRPGVDICDPHTNWILAGPLRMLKMPVMHKLDCRISDPSSYWGELGPREYVRRYYEGAGKCEGEVVVL